MKSFRSPGANAVALLCAAAFLAGAQFLKTAPRQTVEVEMQVALPLFVQVAMTVGDRYLAANLAAIRALVASTEKMKADDYAILARVQQDVSWLNPAHEDNYYIAAAILPWVGEIDATQAILARAAKSRPFDYQPAFYYAFHLLHFKGDAAAASAALRDAAEHMPEGDDRLNMQNLAAIWLDRAQDIELSIRVVQAMAQQSKRRDFRAYLEQRVTRLKNLKALRAAAAVFVERTGRTPVSPEELVEAGLIPTIPADPFGFGFAVTKSGQIALRNEPPKRLRP